MTNPTNPFNWQMPTASDLVTDLPADFEVFGQAVATSMADLLGGTTGQVLSKASNTDMDFTWVAQDDSNAIQNAIVDAKGDLITATAADTPARLAVGNNGETLVADSAATTGLRYSATPSASNPVINSAFQVAQRGTTFTVGSGYTLDRWYGYSGGAGRTISRQTTGDTTNLPNIQYCARIQRDSGNSATNEVQFYNSFESINSIPFAGKTITLSFYARKGANYAPTTANALECDVTSGTGTDQNVISSYTGADKFLNANVTLTTTWQRFSVTGTMPATGTEMFVRFRTGGNAYTGTAGAADYYEVTGVQIDIGSVALPFRTNGGTFQGELAACQRYYSRWANPDNSYPYIAFGMGASTTVAKTLIVFPVEMRTRPTVVDYSSLFVSDTISSWTGGTVTIANANTKSASIDYTTGATLTQLRPYFLVGNTSGFLGISAEL